MELPLHQRLIISYFLITIGFSVSTYDVYHPGPVLEFMISARNILLIIGGVTVSAYIFLFILFQFLEYRNEVNAELKRKEEERIQKIKDQQYQIYLVVRQKKDKRNKKARERRRKKKEALIKQNRSPEEVVSEVLNNFI